MIRSPSSSSNNSSSSDSNSSSQGKGKGNNGKGNGQQGKGKGKGAAQKGGGKGKGNKGIARTSGVINCTRADTPLNFIIRVVDVVASRQDGPTIYTGRCYVCLKF